MKTIHKYFLIAVTATALISCKNEEIKPQTMVQNNQELTAKEIQTPQKGHHVPTDEVCMVNDMHMGKKQMEVPFEGKIYYGCCAMCVKRIPNDESVRKATDPFTGKKIDKASAYIISLNEKGNVAYFESEENYKKFITANTPN